jgi:hypothetical protein
MGVFAGFLEHTDHHVGRLIDTLADLEVLEDTLVSYIVGDNGPSAEGSPRELQRAVRVQRRRASRDAGVPGVEDGRLRRTGGVQPLRGRVDPRDRHAAPVNETGRVALRRRPNRLVAVHAEGGAAGRWARCLEFSKRARFAAVKHVVSSHANHHPLGRDRPGRLRGTAAACWLARRPSRVGRAAGAGWRDRLGASRATADSRCHRGLCSGVEVVAYICGGRSRGPAGRPVGRSASAPVSGTSRGPEKATRVRRNGRECVVCGLRRGRARSCGDWS